MDPAGLLNPARNYLYFSEYYVTPMEHYMSFFLLGALPGYIFFCYIQREMAEETIQAAE